MAFFVNPSSKLEKAVRALLILQGKATWGNSFISNDSRLRVLPNRTLVVSSFQPEKPYRPEGRCFLEIQHHFPAIVQPNQQNAIGQPDENAQQKNLDIFFGDTMDTLNLGGINDQDMTALANAITSAGRWLAVPDGTPEGNQIAADNAEMANFACKWVKFNSPMISRGNPGRDDVNWAEIIHLVAYVNFANAANDNNQ